MVRRPSPFSSVKTFTFWFSSPLSFFLPYFRNRTEACLKVLPKANKPLLPLFVSTRVRFMKGTHSPHSFRCLDRNESDFSFSSTGIMETIKLRKAGFPNRMPFETWAHVYELLFKEYVCRENIEEYLAAVCHPLPAPTVSLDHAFGQTMANPLLILLVGSCWRVDLFLLVFDQKPLSLSLGWQPNLQKFPSSPLEKKKK